MSGFAIASSPEFLARLADGMVRNFEIAGLALCLGFLLGLFLAIARGGPSLLRRGTVAVLGVLRAAPTFVVMFFLLHAIPAEQAVLGYSFRLSGVLTVALSLVPYSAAYVADNGGEALDHLRQGSLAEALLFLPGLSRAFFVLVMASSTGAAIGVPEGISVIVREAEHLPALGDKLALFGVGVVAFGIVLQGGFALVSLAHRGMVRALAEK